LVCPNLLLRNYRDPALDFQRSLVIDLRKYENRARVRFIPHLKVCVFVTVRAHDVVIALKINRRYTEKGRNFPKPPFL